MVIVSALCSGQVTSRPLTPSLPLPSRPHHPRGILSLSDLQTMAGCQSAVESSELREVEGLGRTGEFQQQGGGTRFSWYPSQPGQQQWRPPEPEVKNYSQSPLRIYHLAHPEPAAVQRPSDQRLRQPRGRDEGHHCMSGTGTELVFV